MEKWGKRGSKARELFLGNKACIHARGIHILAVLFLYRGDLSRIFRVFKEVLCVEFSLKSICSSTH
jgi:hypothetical protein